MNCLFCGIEASHKRSVTGVIVPLCDEDYYARTYGECAGKLKEKEMALTPIHPHEARPKGSNGPFGRGKVSGKTPPRGGHPVRGRGTSAPKGSVSGKTYSKKSTPVGGKGTKSSRGGHVGSGSY